MSTPALDPSLLEAAGVTEQEARDQMLSPGQLEGLAAEKREAEVWAQAEQNGYSYDEFQLISSLQNLAEAAPAPEGYHHGTMSNDGHDSRPNAWEALYDNHYGHNQRMAYGRGYREGRALHGSGLPGTSYYDQVSESRKSHYRGVSWFKRGQKWRVAVKIAELGKNDIHIGFFVDEEEAARAYDVTLLGIFGRSLSLRHRTNFELDEYTFDKIPPLWGLNREGIREELESWFGPARFSVYLDGVHVYRHRNPGYKGLQRLRASSRRKRSASQAREPDMDWAESDEETRADEITALPMKSCEEVGDGATYRVPSTSLEVGIKTEGPEEGE